MTFSIVARCPDTGRLGVAVASCVLAVGSRIGLAEAGVGVVVAQAGSWLHWRQAMLDDLRAGRSAAEAVERVRREAGGDEAQLAAVGTTGAASAWTGPGCTEERGHLVDDEVSAQANTMLSPEVPTAMVSAYRAGTGPFERRLVDALAAAEEVGSDYRGRQSASLLVVSGERGYLPHGDAADPTIDLRVDDHPDPVAELGRLLTVRDAHLLLVEGTELDDVDDGLERLREAARLAPTDPLVGPVAALWAAMAGQRDEARALMDVAVATNPQAWDHATRFAVRMRGERGERLRAFVADRAFLADREG